MAHPTFENQSSDQIMESNFFQKISREKILFCSGNSIAKKKTNDPNVQNFPKFVPVLFSDMNFDTIVSLLRPTLVQKSFDRF